MRRSSDYYNRQPGWDTTSNDYYSHISRIERMPSVLTDVPQYPNVHMVFNNRPKAVAKEEDNGQQQQQQQQQKPVTETHKKVHFAEEKETTEIEKDGSRQEVKKTSVDDDADGYIQQTRRNFRLSKWTTFKA